MWRGPLADGAVVCAGALDDPPDYYCDPVRVPPSRKRLENHQGIQTSWFRDSGVGVMRAGASLLVTHCGPPCSQTSHANTTCCCDRLVLAPVSGNFVYLHEGRKVLHTAEGGYRMCGEVGNVLLVDGRGQKGDIDMPMSYPDFQYHGEKMVDVSDAGVRMDLTPAYEGLTQYERCLRSTPAGGLEVEDTVQPVGAHTLTWRFQTYRRNAWEQTGPCAWRLFVDDRAYDVQFTIDAVNVQHQISPTRTVWGYVNENEDEPCHHLRIEVTGRAEPVVLRLCVIPQQKGAP